MLSYERQSARMSKITNDGLTQIWHRMLYSCTHMTAVGVKGLTAGRLSVLPARLMIVVTDVL